MKARVLPVLIALLFVTSCGGSSPPTSPSEDRISGAWIGNSTLTSVSGGECVGFALQNRIGSRDIFSARIQQDGSTLAASLTYQGNRTSCVYRGSTGQANVDLNLDSCSEGRVESFQCADGRARLLEVAATRVAARAASGTGTGTDVTTWNVFEPGNSTPIASLTTTTQFTWNLLGIPHSDFHIFDGSVRPGYVDGITVIPADETPFCDKCGWF